jgi:hypothetical protein
LTKSKKCAIIYTEREGRRKTPPGRGERKMKERLNQINYRLWEISMADFIRGDERREYEALQEEKRRLEEAMRKEGNN